MATEQVLLESGRSFCPVTSVVLDKVLANSPSSGTKDPITD